MFSRFENNSLIQEGEGPIVSLLFGISVFYGFAVVFSYTSALSIFLTEFEASQLSYIYILAAVLIALFGYVNVTMSRHQSPQFLFIGILLFSAVLGTILRFGLFSGGSTIVIFLLLIWFRLVFATTGYIFRGASNQLLTLRQAKRLLGPLNSGATVANIIGYAVVPLLLNITTTENLIYLAVACLVAMAALTAVAFRLQNEQHTTQSIFGAQEEFQIRQPLRDRYIRNIFLISFFVYIIYFFIDFIFYGEVAARFEDTEALAIFISRFYSIVYAIGFTFQILATSPMLRRFGLRNTLSIFPIAIGALAVLFLTGNGLDLTTLFFTIVLGLKFFDEVLQISFVIPAFTLLFQPFSAAKKIATQTFNDIVAIPITIGISGIVIILVIFFELPTWSLIVLVLLACGLLLSFINQAFKGYTNSLIQSLTLRQINGGEVNLSDRGTIEIIVDKLSSKHIGEIIYAIELLTRAEAYDRLNPALKNLLYHPDPTLRREVTNRIVDLKISPLVPFLQKRYQVEDDPGVQRTIVEAMGKLGGPDIINELVDLIDHQNPQIRFASMVGLLQSGLMEGQSVSAKKLEDLVLSESSADRLLSARIIRAVGSEAHESHLLLMLRDQDDDVVRESILSIGKLRLPGTLKKVIEYLADPLFEQAAAVSLMQAGEAGLKRSKTLSKIKPTRNMNSMRNSIMSWV